MLQRKLCGPPQGGEKEREWLRWNGPRHTVMDVGYVERRTGLDSCNLSVGIIPSYIKHLTKLSYPKYISLVLDKWWNVWASIKNTTSRQFMSHKLLIPWWKQTNNYMDIGPSNQYCPFWGDSLSAAEGCIGEMGSSQCSALLHGNGGDLGDSSQLPL